MQMYRVVPITKRGNQYLIGDVKTSIQARQTLATGCLNNIDIVGLGTRAYGLRLGLGSFTYFPCLIIDLPNLETTQIQQTRAT